MFTENGQEQNQGSDNSVGGNVDKRGQRRTARLVQAGKNARVA